VKAAAGSGGDAIRLQRYLAMAGVAARRKAEDLITAGRVTVNGQVVRELGTKVSPDRDEVLVDGEAVVALDHFYILFNKPKGSITAVTDDRGRTTVMDYLPNVPVPVKPVGRLDYYSEGVLLLTNDGELHDRLLAPRQHVPKTYHVKVRGRIEPRHMVMLRDGVRLDDGTTTLPAEVEPLPAESKHAWVAITIHEGKSRQIHRMMEALGYVVTKLQRVAFANLTFHGLRVGDARELTQAELNDLRDLVGLDHSATARGKWKAKREDTDFARRAKDKVEDEREAERVRKLPAPERAEVVREAQREEPRRPAPRPGPRPAQRPGPRPPNGKRTGQGRGPRPEPRQRGHSKRGGQGRKARGPGKRR
jgi:23S rRNA pseudouridine2605 synthase